MALVEGRLAGHRAVDGDVHELRQLPQLLGGLGEQHAHTRVDHRPLCVQEELHGVLDVAAGRGKERAFGRVVVQRLLRHLLGAYVGGHLHDHRAGAAVAQRVEGPSHRAGDLSGAEDYLPIPHHRLVRPDRREVGPDRVLLKAGAALEDQDGNIVAEGLGDAAHRVLGAGPALRNDGAEAPPVAHAAISVGRHYGAALVSKHDGPDPLDGGGLDQVVRWEARYKLDPFALEDAGYGVVDVHLHSPCWL